MKKAVVPTTAASGTAVSSSRMTAVQSVYIGGIKRLQRPFQQVSCAARYGAMDWRDPPSLRMPHPLPPAGGPGRLLAVSLFAAVVLPLLLADGLPSRAGVRFENCVTAADGSITCDTVPTGNTLADDEAARFGFFDNASPGWSEFDPYAGYEDDFGGNQT